MTRARDFADLAGSADAGGLTGRNLVVNGSFAISQRGTSFSSPNATYTLDRMRCAQANSADTISQQTFTAGQTDVPGSPKNFLRFAFGAATANRVLETRIEDVYTGSGQSITLSFYAKASEAHTSTIELTQSFGSGGSSDVAFGTQNYSITTSFQRFEFTLSCPSISGKTIGAGNYLSVAFIRSLSAGASIDVDIALLQLEVGETATPFEHEEIGTTLRKCQRYYFKFLEGGTKEIGVAWYYTASHSSFMLRYPTTMRATPTGIDTTGTNFYGIYRAGALDSIDSITFENGSTEQYSAYNASEVSGTAGQAGLIRSTNASAKIEFDAEL